MKKILTAIAGLLITGNAVADIHVTSVPEFSGDTLTVAYVSLNDVMTKSRKDLTPVVKEEIIRPDFTIATAGTEPMRFDLRFVNSRERFFANANDKINVQLNNDGSMIITGTPLLDQVADLRNKLQGPMQAYAKALENNDEAAAEAADAAADKILADYVAANLTQPGAVWATLQMGDEALLEYAPRLSGEATTCVLYPLLQNSVKRAEQRKEAEEKRQNMAQNQVEAPDFNLPDLKGQMVKLSDFKGKWVVLDFWGSWCPWCIKGFPGLKDTYQKYHGKLEIIGVDCNDPEANWRAAVKKYALPWVNVYNAKTSGGVLEDYGVMAFPTKILINPQGRIQKIYVGEDPEFYTDVEALVK